MSTRKIVNSGVLAAIVILLGVTRIGFIPVPTPAGNMTFMHIPAIVGGVLEGWVVGGIIGTIFGIISFFQATVPLFKDPLVAIFPRIFIGITAALCYAVLHRWNEYVALVVAAAIGTLTNTALVLSMAVVRNYLTMEQATAIAIGQGIPEAIVAVIVVLAIVMAWKRVETGVGAKSRVSQM
ncbi:MAG: ECF transporter S component [Chloroflexota bacterium]